MSRVSVCIPSCNRSRYIGETIQSILDSTYSNLEVIVNDNASTDDTREIVEAFSDKRVCFYQNESDIGPVKNWNHALKKASGEFVGLLYSDDLYGPFWLTLVVHVLDKYPHIGWAVSAFRVIDHEGRLLNTVSCFPDTREYSPSETFPCVAKLNGLGPAFIVRREILEQVNYYDENAGLSADNDLFLRLASRYPLYYSSNAHHAAYRRHAESLTHQWGHVEQAEEGLRMLNKVFNDKAFPAELCRYKRSCYTYYYQKVFSRAKRAMENNDIETTQALIHLLDTNGYRV